MALVIKNLPANAGDGRDSGLIPRLGRSPGRRNGTHSSILTWRIPWAEKPSGLHAVHGVTKSWTRLKSCTNAVGALLYITSFAQHCGILLYFTWVVKHSCFWLYIGYAGWLTTVDLFTLFTDFRCCFEHASSCLLVDICIHFCWVCIWEWNCWVQTSALVDTKRLHFKAIY